MPWRDDPPAKAERPARWRENPGSPIGPASANGATRESRPMAPLAGVTVLDLGTITAGAAVGRLLADYGATVIKVENPQQPDPFRQWAAASGVAAGESPLFEANNAGKLGVSLDLKQAGGAPGAAAAGGNGRRAA